VTDVNEMKTTGNPLFDDEDDFNEYGKGYVVKHEDGDELYYHNYACLEGHGRYSAQICIGTKEDNIMDIVILDNILRGLRRNATMMSLDQVVGGGVNGMWEAAPHNRWLFGGCWNESHGHPIGIGKWTHDRYVELLEDINNLVEEEDRKKDFVLTMEWPNELYIQHLQSAYQKATSVTSEGKCPGDKSIPLFNYVYNENYIGIEQGQHIDNKEPEWDKFYRWTLGMDFANADIPGITILRLYSKYFNEERFNFFKKLIKYRDVKLRYSEMLNPPEFEGMPEEIQIEIPLRNSSYNANRIYIDEVLSNVFKTPDNQIAYLFVNTRRLETTPVTINFDLSKYDLPYSEFDVYKRVNGKRYLLFSRTDLPEETQLDIDGEDVIEILVKPSFMSADFDGDGDVDVFDIVPVTIHFGLTDSDPEWNETIDVIPNNEIDIYDLVFVVSRFT